MEYSLVIVYDNLIYLFIYISHVVRCIVFIVKKWNDTFKMFALISILLEIISCTLFMTEQG